MQAGRVLLLTGDLDDGSVFGVDASSGTPLYTDGPFIESEGQLGGFTVVNVAAGDARRGCGPESGRSPAAGRTDTRSATPYIAVL